VFCWEDRLQNNVWSVKWGYASNPILLNFLSSLYSLGVRSLGWGYRDGSPTAVQAWQTCPLFEPSPSHPILLYTMGLAVLILCISFCMYIIVYVYVYLVVFVFFFVFCSISFSTLILLVGSFDL